MGFTMLDEGILQSSIMSAHPVTFKVWVALLAACRPNGVAPVSPSYIASVCRLTAKEVTRALEELAAPDENSRSLDEDGRRIVRVDGGFRLVTYRKRRELALKAAESAGRVERRRRAQEPDVRTESGHSPDSYASVSAFASRGEGAGGGSVAPYRPAARPAPLDQERHARIERRHALCRENPRLGGETPEDHRRRIDALMDGGAA